MNPASSNGTSPQMAMLAEIERWGEHQKDLLELIRQTHGEWEGVNQQMADFAEKHEVFKDQEMVNKYVQMTRDRDVLAERVARLVQDYEFHKENHERIMAELS